MSESRRIILAEDDGASRALLVRQLSKAGYSVAACENGRDALHRVQDEGACIVLADWMMPQMDGIELCRAIRELNDMQALPFVYFVLLTAHSDKQQIVAGLEAGADDYLTKPYHVEELLARLRAGERIFELQTQLVKRQVELHKANAEMAVLNAKLEGLANTDGLTGLPNRRWLFERFHDVWSQAQRHDRPLSCIMLDVDRFKSVNDTFGHAAGDVVLQGVAAVCRDTARGHDLVGRFGGEEFCIACPETPLAGAAALAERIRVNVAQRLFRAGEATIRVTVSLGVAERQSTQQKQDDGRYAAVSRESQRTEPR